MPRACKRCGKCCTHSYFIHSEEDVLNNMRHFLKKGDMKSFQEWAVYIAIMKRKRRLKNKNWV